MEKFARTCSATGIGFNAGYCVNDGELYFADKEHLIEYLRGLNWEDCDGVNSRDIDSDDDLMEFFYNQEVYYYSEWDADDEDDEG
jgi:hypothetical protein